MLQGVNPATWMLEVTGGAKSVSTTAVQVSAAFALPFKSSRVCIPLIL